MRIVKVLTHLCKLEKRLMQNFLNDHQLFPLLDVVEAWNLYYVRAAP